MIARWRWRWCVAALGLAGPACTDGSKPGATDHASTQVCSGRLYDACSADDQCASGTCKLYSNRGIHVCTQACSDAAPCPAHAGQPATCTKQSLCRPDAANACEPR